MNIMASVRGALLRLGALTDGELHVGQTGLEPLPKTISGDATLAKTGALTIAAGAITLAKMAAAVLTGTAVAVNAADAVIGSIPVVHRIAIAAGALAEKDIVLTHKTLVTDVQVVLAGAGVATTTLKVQNGATAITDAIAVSGADKAIIRAATLDDAQWEIAAGGTLRIKTETGATQPACVVIVRGLRVA